MFTIVETIIILGFVSIFDIDGFLVFTCSLLLLWDGADSPSLYLHVHRPDTRRIFVDIGLGFHVEFTWSEALNYISQREEKLARYELLL